MPPIHACTVHCQYNPIKRTVCENQVFQHHKEVLGTLHIVVFLRVRIFEIGEDDATIYARIGIRHFANGPVRQLNESTCDKIRT